MPATLGWLARIIGAWVIVVAGEGRSAHASTVATDVVSCARIPVVTHDRVTSVDAARHRVARIVRAQITVVAVKLLPASTSTNHAGITSRAGIPVVAFNSVEFVYASRCRQAGICRALVVIVTIGRSNPDALSART